MEATVSFEPALNSRMFMCRIVVDNEGVDQAPEEFPGRSALRSAANTPFAFAAKLPTGLVRSHNRMRGSLPKTRLPPGRTPLFPSIRARGGHVDFSLTTGFPHDGS